MACHSGPEIPPSLRMRQKWTARKIAAIEREDHDVEHVEPQQRVLADLDAAQEEQLRSGCWPAARSRPCWCRS